MNTPTSAAKAHAVPLGTEPSFGFGDRLGLATPGHIAALRHAGGPIRGIFAQQSIREMTRTHRTAPQVMQAALDALDAARFEQPWSSDADHLKTEADVDVTAEAGFIFFTIDPSDHVDRTATRDDAAMLEKKFQAVAGDLPWLNEYQGKTFRLGDSLTIVFDELTLKRAAVKYGRAIEEGIKLGRYIQQKAASLDQPCEIELSVDETDEPTTPAEHYLIADQFHKRGVKLVSLAPRFVGELEKGIDYIGDLGKLETSLNEHGIIAREIGPYKLSLHSGSDKISMYPALARATQGMFHVKTAGTSYLEALRVLAMHEPHHFRRFIDFAREHYEQDRATYHVHATVESVFAPADVQDDHQLASLYLEHWADVPAGKGFTAPGRQMLHCTFGSTVTDPTFGPILRQCLTEHAETYEHVLKEHFVRHLEALRI